MQPVLQQVDALLPRGRLLDQLVVGHVVLAQGHHLLLHLADLVLQLVQLRLLRLDGLLEAGLDLHKKGQVVILLGFLDFDSFRCRHIEVGDKFIPFE